MFTDHTVNKAVALGLPVYDIQCIVQTLLKYPVSLFELESDCLEAFPALRELLPDFMIRVNVRPSAESAAGLSRLRQIRINWNPVRESSLDFLYQAAESAAASNVFLGLENAQALAIDEFDPYFEWARSVHAKGIVYCCNGTEDVHALYNRLLKIVKHAPCPIEFDTRNSLGLAAAQSLAALKAGLACVSGSVAGICGDSPVEETLMTAKHLWHYAFSQGKSLAGDFQLISTLLGIRVPFHKALIGPDVFAHESGIHVDGILKDPAVYEVIRPEDVGLKRKLVIGKHSGTASLKIKGLQWGFRLTNEEASCLLESVRELAQDQKGPLSDRQLMELLAARCVKKEAKS